MQITISRKHVTLLEGYAKEAAPQESCALLFGKDGQHITDVFPTDNADESPERFFTIPADQLLAAYRRAEELKKEVVGIFHSHPSSPAYPSRTDMQFMRANPVVWIIYSGVDGTMRAYALKGTDAVRNVEIVTSDGQSL